MEGSPRVVNCSISLLLAVLWPKLRCDGHFWHRNARPSRRLCSAASQVKRVVTATPTEALTFQEPEPSEALFRLIY